jgi:5-methylcytosine-specific restriction enzyme A
MPARIANPAESLPWRAWYGLWFWKKRQRHQMRIEPLCAECLKAGRVTAATIADHNPPHGGVWNAFRLGPLQSLCVDCHQGKWANDRRGYSCSIGDDGFPVDPKHPFNVRRPSDGGPAAGELREGHARSALADPSHLSDRKAPPQPLLGYPDDSPRQPKHVRRPSYQPT